MGAAFRVYHGRLILDNQELPVPLADPTWPWTPATLTQGFLSGRWLRRDGTVYGPGVAPGQVRGVNSPVAPGEDEGETVDVSSGAPLAKT